MVKIEEHVVSILFGTNTTIMDSKVFSDSLFLAYVLCRHGFLSFDVSEISSAYFAVTGDSIENVYRDCLVSGFSLPANCYLSDSERSFFKNVHSNDNDD